MPIETSQVVSDLNNWLQIISSILVYNLNSNWILHDLLYILHFDINFYMFLFSSDLSRIHSFLKDQLDLV